MDRVLEDLFKLKTIKEIGSGDFEIYQESDLYFDDLEVGFSLKNNLLYIYYHNCPGRELQIYEWPYTKPDFDELMNIVDAMAYRTQIVELCLSAFTSKKEE